MRRPWSFVIRHSSFVLRHSSLVLVLLAAASGARAQAGGRAAVGGRSAAALSHRNWRRCGDEEALGQDGDWFLRDQRPGHEGRPESRRAGARQDAPVDHAARPRQSRARLRRQHRLVDRSGRRAATARGQGAGPVEVRGRLLPGPARPGQVLVHDRRLAWTVRGRGLLRGQAGAHLGAARRARRQQERRISRQSCTAPWPASR